MNLDCLPCCCRRAAILMCLLLLRALGYHQLHQPPMFWFINCPICKFSRIYWPANNKKLMNLDCLACCCRCVVILLCLLLLIVPPNIISFLDLQCFIDSSIAPFASLLGYIDLLTTKKLINLDCLARCCYCACCSQCSQIFFVSLCNLIITIMLMNLDCLVLVAIAICFVLQLLSTLSCFCCPPRFNVAHCLVLLLLSARLIELTLVEC